MSALIATFPDGWELRHAPSYECRRSVRWLPVVLANPTLPRAWGQLRTLRLVWSVPEQRFGANKFSEHLAREWPALHERVSLFLDLHAADIAAARRQLLEAEAL